MLRRPHAAPPPSADAGRHAGFVLIGGQPYVTIRDVDRMSPFLMNVVGNGDVWMFVGSNAALTAGRRDPDRAIFPYQTVDKLLALPEASGIVSLFRVDGTVWEPWRQAPLPAGCARHLHKHECGTSVVFEETNQPLGLRVRWRLAASETFGIVRAPFRQVIGSASTLKSRPRSRMSLPSLSRSVFITAPSLGTFARIACGSLPTSSSSAR
jgi:hypothetical protein